MWVGRNLKWTLGCRKTEVKCEYERFLIYKYKLHITDIMLFSSKTNFKKNPVYYQKFSKFYKLKNFTEIKKDCFATIYFGATLEKEI